MKSKTLKIALPAGSLKEATIELFRKAGFKISVSDRSYLPLIDDTEIECMLIRAQEIPRYVEQGKFDMGLTGYDQIKESEAKIKEIAELSYSKNGFNPVKIVIAVPNDSPIKTVADLEGKTIVTELVNVTQNYLKRNGVKSNVEYSWGATESKPPKLADAIAELSDSGRSLKANNLKIIATILESTTRIIANKESYKNTWKKQKIDNIAMLLVGAMNAESRVGLKMNVPKKQINKIICLIPSLCRPTVANLAIKDWCALESIVPESDVRKIIPLLKAQGAEGIIEYPLNKVIY